MHLSYASRWAALDAFTALLDEEVIEQWTALNESSEQSPHMVLLRAWDTCARILDEPVPFSSLMLVFQNPKSLCHEEKMNQADDFHCLQVCTSALLACYYYL